MGLLAWIVIGLVAGLLAEVILPRSIEDKPANLLGTMIVGLVGAVTGGWLWQIALSRPNAAIVDGGTAFVALVGSLAIISILRLFTRRYVVFENADDWFDRS